MPDEAHYDTIDVIKAGVLTGLCTVVVTCIFIVRPDLGLTGSCAMGALLMSSIHYIDDLMQPSVVVTEKS